MKAFSLVSHPTWLQENARFFENMAQEMDGKICQALKEHNIETVVQTMSQETFFQTRLYYPETTQYWWTLCH